MLTLALVYIANTSESHTVLLRTGAGRQRRRLRCLLDIWAPAGQPVHAAHPQLPRLHLCSRKRHGIQP